MTRARLIEKVIAEWLETSNGFIIDDASGHASSQPFGDGDVVLNVADCAAYVDAEFDRIAREATG